AESAAAAKDREAKPEPFVLAAERRIEALAWEEARDYLEQALAAATGPEHKAIRIRALDLMARVRRSLGDGDGALAALLELRDLAPERADVLRRLGDAALDELKDVDRAEGYYAQYVARVPEDSHAWLILGGLRKEQGDWAKAAEAFEEARRLGAGAAADYELARAYYALGRVEDARAAAERFVASDADPELRKQVAEFLRSAFPEKR
ncbi:MAG: tetratricopeptide repeat protein, partial [Planctomycetes bacterium]|nr:tetratricopeptide repeat protein [Planctomycetota bacterium]